MLRLRHGCRRMRGEAADAIRPCPVYERSMNFLHNIKIGKRLCIGFGLLLLLSIAITVTAMMKLDAVGAASREMMALPLMKERMIGDWVRNISNAVLRTTAISMSA